MSPTRITEPILMELDDETRNGHLDRVEAWLGTTLMAQAAFRQLAEDTLEKATDPWLKEYLQSTLEEAKKHERKAEELHRAIGRDPSRARAAGGDLMGKARQAAANLMGPGSGAGGTWSDLRQLYLASQNALGAFSVAEQLGFALGNREVAEISFAVTTEKYGRHLQLQEMILELAPAAILYDQPV